MKNIAKRIIQKIIALTMIIIMTLADFSVIGANVISYALNENENVEFSVFFVNDENQRITNIETSIDSELYMYVEIALKKGGYFNGQLELGETSFNLNEEIVENNEYIKKIENNVVTLNRIDAGAVALIKLKISYANAEEINPKLLNQENEIKLTGKGKYLKSEEEIDIEEANKVQINWKSPDDIKAKLSTEILTNAIYKFNESDNNKVNKRVIQVLINSKIEKNAYPVKNTLIQLNIPNGVETVKVHARSTYATDGNKNNIEYARESGVLSINIKNECVEDKIKWIKNVEDVIVVTYIYPESINLEDEKINTDAKITTYDDNILSAERSQLVVKEEKDGILTGKIIEGENSIYKGKIYTGEEREYTSTTKLNIDCIEAIQEIEILEKVAKFKSDTEEKEANIQYKKSKIEKSKFDEILGDEWHVTILDQDGITVASINNNTAVDENGNIVIEYNKGIKQISIKIMATSPKTNGMLNIEHTKSILNSGLSEEKIKEINQINHELKIEYKKIDEQVSAKNVLSKIELKEPSIQTKIEINKEILTADEKNEDVIIEATLLTDGEDKKLYTNPIIKINLPKEVDKIENEQIKVLNGMGLEFKECKVIEENETKVFLIYLKGEQTKYVQEIIDGTIIRVRFACNLNNLAINGEKTISLNISNEKCSETKVKIINSKSIIMTNNVVGYESKQRLKLQVDKEEKILNIQANIINNEGEKISNLKVMGVLPTNNSKNNLGIMLKNGINVNIESAKVYYTDNENATEDITNEENGWKEQILENVKKYLIIVDELEEAKKLNISYEIKIPKKLEYNISAESTYVVSYLNNANLKEKTENAPTLLFETGSKISIQQQIKATVGNDILNDGDEVKSGEIITYEIILENTGDTEKKGIKVNANIPKGTTRVILKEIPDLGSKEYVETNDENIEFENIDLKKAEKITLKYYVKVNQDIVDNTETTCEISTLYNSQDIETTMKHKLRKADIDVKLKVVQRMSEKIQAGYNYEYSLIITNNSNADKYNVKVNLNVNELLEITRVMYSYEDKDYNNVNENKKEEFNIEKIKAGDSIAILITTIVKNTDKELSNAEISVNVIDDKDITYRSNKIIEEVEMINIDLNVKTETDSVEKESYVVSGNTIKYIITAKNNGNKDAEEMVIEDMVSNYLTIKSVKLDGKEVKYDKRTYFENDKSFTIISVEKPLKVSESCNIEITTTVNLINTDDILTIINKVYAKEYITLKEVEANLYYIKSKDTSNITIPETKEDKFSIKGTVWKDENKDGERTSNENKLSSINIILYNITKNKYVKSVKTDTEGNYSFTDIEKGKYIVIFEYDTKLYIPTIYQGEKIAIERNSDAIKRTITLNGEKKEVAVTDIMNLTENALNVDLGVIELEKFDLELNKYVTKITVVNSRETKTYNFDKTTLGKVEIGSKYMNGSQVIIEYTIEVKNTGELSGYVQKIVDYKSTSLKFSSELNKDWYQSGKYLYNESLADIELKAGESKEVNLVLTKTMTDSNIGIVNNTAEIAKVYNDMNLSDIDSIAGNNQNDEDDFGNADVIISIKTGGTINYILCIITTIVILISICYLKNINILKILQR